MTSPQAEGRRDSIHAPSQEHPASVPMFTAREGKVFQRGTYVPEPSRRLALFEAAAEVGDWFSPFAAQYAADLRDAISVAEDYPHIQEEAA